VQVKAEVSMSVGTEIKIQLAPYIRGAGTAFRQMIRRTDAPNYISLTTTEMEVVEELKKNPVSVSEYLAKHLSGHLTLDFRAAVTLLIHLHQSNFVLNASDETVTRLKEFSEVATGSTQSGIKKLSNLLTLLLDSPVIEFRNPSIHPAFRKIGGYLVSVPFVIGVTIIMVLLALYTGISSFVDPTVYKGDFGEPESLLLKGFFSFSIAMSWIAFVQMAALAGTGATFVGGSIRLTGLCIIRLAVNDQDALMLPKARMFRYHIVTIFAPWLSALGAWQLAGTAAFTSFAGLFSGVFALIGLFMVCPLIKSPIVKLAEGFLATDNIFQKANAFLAKGLFNFKNAESSELDDKASNLWITCLATLSIGWLYFMSLVFFDALLSATTDLWLHIYQHSNLMRTLAAGFVLLILLTAMVLPLMRLILIPFQNLAALADIPVRRARRGISSYYSPSISPSDAVVNFLKEIPILAELTTEELNALTAVLKYRRFNRGENIITRGENADAFYILADGQAQVILGGGESPEDVVDLLNPGDSFGEIALIEKGKRTASIRAVAPCKTLVLQKPAFDRLFVENSPVRQRLTETIRLVKLVLESQTMSHLAPRQIRELLRSSKLVTYKAGEYIIRENETGDAAFLIKTGKAQVQKDGANAAIAESKRGDLIGAIALIRAVKRTASVVALEDTECLKIDKETFLKMCMSNMFVALLVTDLSEKQLANVKVG
jgi:CRP-like cAMP-binding protein